MSGRLVRVVVLVVVTLSTASCTHVRPWERGKLAHPTMAGPLVPGVAEEHMYAVHEGAVGGSGGAESGCGCN